MASKPFSMNNIEHLVARARSKGITSFALRSKIHELVTDGVSPDHWRYQELWEQAEKISRAGLRSQLSFLYQVLGMQKAISIVDSINALDTFTGAVSSAEPPIVEKEEDLDEDGDPWE